MGCACFTFYPILRSNYEFVTIFVYLEKCILLHPSALECIFQRSSYSFVVGVGV